MQRYLVRSFEVPGEWCEAFSALAWAEGAMGVRLEDEAELQRLDVYFPLDPPPPAFETARWAPCGVRLVAERVEEEQDWNARHRELASPVVVGDLVLDPREPGCEPPPLAPGQRLLRLPARRAFGTGSHPSTRLALALLARTPLAGRRVLDVGSGTGVLAFAARLWGSGGVVALDVDPEAVLLARENAILNAVGGVALLVGGLGALGDRLPFERVLVNVLPHRVLGELRGLASRLPPGAVLVFSGLSDDTVDAVCGVLAEEGWRETDRAEEEEWVAVRLESPP